MNRNKPFGGYLQNWCWHRLNDQATEEVLATLRERGPAARPEFISAEVIEDTMGRWQSGSTMCSSPLVAFDERTLRVETLNTIYQLVGPGRISRSYRGPIEEEVGRTILLLAKDQGLQVKTDSMDILVYPGKDAPS